MNNGNYGYVLLAKAIVLQAFNDFKRDAKIVKQGGIYVNYAKKEMKEIVEFVKSSWFNTLCVIDQKQMLRKLKEVARGDS